MVKLYASQKIETLIDKPAGAPLMVGLKTGGRGGGSMTTKSWRPISST